MHGRGGDAGPDVRSNISDAFARLLKEYYGKGPQRTHTTYDGEVVLVMAYGGFTPAEQTLRAAGLSDAVIEQRLRFQDAMRAKFIDCIEQETRRKVVAFVSGAHQDPDLSVEVFLLEPEDRA